MAPARAVVPALAQGAGDRMNPALTDYEINALMWATAQAHLTLVEYLALTGIAHRALARRR